MSAPPYTALADFATALGAVVTDPKAAGKSDADFVTEAVERLSEDAPLVETADIGDGTTKVWKVIAATTPFDRWHAGFSERFPVEVERLVAAAPVFDAEYLEAGIDFRLEWRTASGVSELWLVFESAPSNADKVRVRWRRRYRLTGASTNEVPGHLHQAVIYKATELKCRALSALYSSTVDLAVNSDVFMADPTASRYAARAKEAAAYYATVLGAGGRGGLTTGAVADRASRVWRS